MTPNPSSAPPSPATVASRAEELVNLIDSFGPVAVAFSGGVDSAVVAKAAYLAAPATAIAVTAVSPSLASVERQTAQQVAQQIGIRQVELATQEFARPEYQANPANRCYFCKTELYSVLHSRIGELGVQTILNGANRDDAGDHRPGMVAATEFSVRSPLLELGFGKTEVRELAQYWNLTVWDKPASPCLASRIAYGVPVTLERVARIEAAEHYLRETCRLREFRVRCEAQELARLELPLSELGRFVAEETRQGVVAYLKKLGFRAVTLDLEGFRSGSLNALVELKI